jgi:hypothetical protein
VAVTTKGKEVMPIDRINKPARANGTYVPRTRETGGCTLPQYSFGGRRMRKAIIALFLLGILVIPAMAEMTAIQGYIDYGFIYNGTDNRTRTYARFDLNAKVGDFNNTYFRLEQVTATSDTSGTPRIRYAYVTTDLAGVLGLGESGIGITHSIGWRDVYDKSYVNLLSRHMVDIGSLDVGIGFSTGVEIDLKKLVTLVFYIDPFEDNDFIAGVFSQQKIGGFPLNVEVMYGGEKRANLSDGQLVIDGEFKPTFGAIASEVNFGFAMNLGASPLDWDYGFGVGATINKIINLRVNLNGDETDILNWISVETALGKFANLLTIRAAGYLQPPATSIFRGFDACAELALGSLTLRTGYFYNNGGNCHTYFTTSPTDGGFYMRGYITWK